MTAIWHALVTMGGVLMAVAIMSRLLTDKDTSTTITDASDALVRLFTGAFGL